MPRPRLQRWLRFLVGGGVNTAFTYAAYLAMNMVLNYQVAYFIAYVSGIVFAYWFNAVVVFRVRLTWKGFFSYPLVYVVQYGASALLLAVVVEVVNVNETLAPLIVAFSLFPVTYKMSKLVLGWTTRSNKVVE